MIKIVTIKEMNRINTPDNTIMIDDGNKNKSSATIAPTSAMNKKKSNTTKYIFKKGITFFIMSDGYNID